MVEIQQLFSDPYEEKRRTLLNLQWLAALATSYLLLFKKAEVVQDPWALSLNLLIREVGQQQMGDLRKKNLSLSVDLDDNLPEIVGDEAQLDRCRLLLPSRHQLFSCKRLYKSRYAFPQSPLKTMVTKDRDGHGFGRL